MKNTITIFISLVLTTYSSFCQVNFNKVSSKKIEFSIRNDSTITAFFLNPFAFAVPEGNKNNIKLFIRRDRIKFNGDTAEVYLSDTSFMNVFEKFNFQDSLAKSFGSYKYESLLPKEIKFFTLLLGIPSKASFLKLFINYSYINEDKKSIRTYMVKVKAL